MTLTSGALICSAAVLVAGALGLYGAAKAVQAGRRTRVAARRRKVKALEEIAQARAVWSALGQWAVNLEGGSYAPGVFGAAE